jgi:lipoyl(octanoyl) transferase
MREVKFEDWGLISYEEAWKKQQSIHDEKIKFKLANRGKNQLHHLIFCEHQPVYTLGKSGSEHNLLLLKDDLNKAGFEFFKINRGGDITYHGPGQIVGYPIFDLDHFFSDVHKYVRFLEESIIQTLAFYGLKGEREPGFTGVWIKNHATDQMRKICAIGVHLSRWVTMHGFAFNIEPKLDHFKNIIPCGITDGAKSVTSLTNELQRNIEMAEVKSVLLKNISEIFQIDQIIHEI